MKKICTILAIMFMALVAPVTCLATPPATSGPNTETVSQDQNREGLSIGAKVGISLGAGCLISLIIVLGMVSGMNTAKEATQADNYYTADGVRVAVSSDRYTHTTRKEVPKAQPKT